MIPPKRSWSCSGADGRPHRTPRSSVPAALCGVAPPPRANHVPARGGRPPRARPLPRFAVAAHVGGRRVSGPTEIASAREAIRFAGKPFGPRYGGGGSTHRPALDVGRVPQPPVSAVDAARAHGVVGRWNRAAAVGLPHSFYPLPLIVVEPFAPCHPHRTCLSPPAHDPGRPLPLRAPDSPLFPPPRLPSCPLRPLLWAPPPMAP